MPDSQLDTSLVIQNASITPGTSRSTPHLSHTRCQWVKDSRSDVKLHNHSLLSHTRCQWVKDSRSDVKLHNHSLLSHTRCQWVKDCHSDVKLHNHSLLSNTHALKSFAQHLTADINLHLLVRLVPFSLLNSLCKGERDVAPW